MFTIKDRCEASEKPSNISKYNLNMYFASLSVFENFENPRNSFLYANIYAKFVVLLVLSIHFKMAKPIVPLFCGFLYECDFKGWFLADQK